MLSIILLAVVCIANMLLAGSVILNNTRGRINQIFANLAVAVPIWSITVFLEDTAVGRPYIALLARFDYLMAMVLAILFYLFCHEFVKANQKIAMVALVAGGILNALLIVTGQTLTVLSQGSDVIFVPRDGFAIYIAYLAVFFVSGLWMLWKNMTGITPKRRAQIKIVRLGFLLTIIAVMFFDVIIPRVFLQAGPDIARAGIYSTIFFTAFGWYAIVKLRFLDVRAAVARSVAYILLLVTLATAYGSVNFLVALLFFPDSSSTLQQGAVYTLLSVALAFSFQPLHRVFQRVTTKIFYRNSYDSNEVLNDFTKILVSERDLDRILKHTISSICESLHIQFGQVVIFNNDRIYRIEHFGKLPRRLMIAPELKQLKHPLLVADELAEGERKKIMEDHGIRVSMILHTREEFVGYLLLGDKLSGDIYSHQDLELLEIMTKELAVAILNAKAYAQIEEFNRTLQARVDHATNRLRIANRHLKELDRAKDEFISMASHQLRTPLTTIKGYLSMMLEGDAGHLTAAQKEFVGYAFGSSERMVNLISDLLNVSRLSAGRFLIQTKPTNMVSMIKDEVRQLKTHASAKNIQLIFDPPPEILPPAEIDENKTRQVVMNFIDNAIYYTNEGEVRVVLEQSGGCVRLEVRDTGIGVPEKAKKKLFSKFFRAENAQIVRPDGTGLGLYLAKRVVEDQGGTIIFNSVEGKGSTFGFELPFTPLTSIREEHHAK